MDADSSRLAALRKLGISRYACVFALCQAGVSTPKIATLFFREPLHIFQRAFILPIEPAVEAGAAD